MKYIRFIGIRKTPVILYFFVCGCICISCNIYISIETKKSPKINRNSIRINDKRLKEQGFNETNNYVLDTLNTDLVHISWSCEDEYKSYYECRYKLDSNKWSAWKNDLWEFNAHLDDSQHTFNIEVRFMNLETPNDTKSVHFYVNALNTPAVYMFPRQQSLTTADTATMIIKGKDLPKSYGIEITFLTDSSNKAEIEANQLYGIDDRNIKFDYENKKAYLMVLGSEPFEGNCDIMSLSISGIVKDSLKIDIDSCFIWDSIGGDIKLKEKRGGFIFKEVGAN